ncbi:MAG: hypothetical protein NVS9B3_00350 [Gemmatimonadaceae bacterium]
MVAAALADARVHAACEAIVIGPDRTPVAVDETVGEWTRDGPPALAGRLAGRAIERAVSCVRRGAAQGIVTAPVDKAALLAGGFRHAGHTEMLAELTGSDVAMMLTSARLRVVLATTHLPLRDVPAAITREVILTVARVTRQGLADWFGIPTPRIALCALNPHVGDQGRFGHEDEEILLPAARMAGLVGPLSADTVFVRALRGEFDAVIAPYHDVGMTAIKVAAFGSAVNVTLGLPFPRTSPDHGTALDIAGRGVADASSFIEAMLLCARIAAHRSGSAGAFRS